ncbi:hypothetical protein ZIOFF_016380 [Zingiber officinale]|uniref:Protein kinase domain-containing protein n=1 Tax=Zingiber officinale TaxID=94328 RepID=A0A8J5LX95_ZINOF|nr:hypothetical protein ZIOFF_016380 [Zingiber officinale]
MDRTFPPKMDRVYMQKVANNDLHNFQSGLEDPTGTIGRRGSDCELYSDILNSSSGEGTISEDNWRTLGHYGDEHSETGFAFRQHGQVYNYNWPESGASESSHCGKMKFLCSFGGKIFPRPGDAKLRYVGGETRIISVSNNITWKEFMQKTLAICKQPHTIKYQLPGEELDALISVASDEDLQNMMEEYCGTEKSDGSKRPRLFLILVNETEIPSSLDSLVLHGGSEHGYVSAVNNMLEPSPRKNSRRNSFPGEVGSLLDVTPISHKESPSCPQLDLIDIPDFMSCPAPEFFFNSGQKTPMRSPPFSPRTNIQQDTRYPQKHSGEDHIFVGAKFRNKPPLGIQLPVISRAATPLQSPRQIKNSCDPQFTHHESNLAFDSKRGHGQDKDNLYLVTKSDALVEPLITLECSDSIVRNQGERKISDASEKITTFIDASPYSNQLDIHFQSQESQRVELCGNLFAHYRTPNYTNEDNKIHMDSLYEKPEITTNKSMMLSPNGSLTYSKEFETIERSFHMPSSFLTSQTHCVKSNNSLESLHLTDSMNCIESSGAGNSSGVVYIQSSEPLSHLPLIKSQNIKTNQEFGSSNDADLDQDLLSHKLSLLLNPPAMVGHLDCIPTGDVLCSNKQLKEVGKESMLDSFPLEVVVSVEDDASSCIIPVLTTTNVLHESVKDIENDHSSGLLEMANVDISPQTENEYMKDETRELDISISDAALAELEAGIYGLQIIKNADLEELRELGSGTFGTVYHGKWRGTDVAIKRIKKSCFEGRSSEQENMVKDFWREAKILSKLQHPNVVAFYGVVPDGTGGTLATVAEFMVNGSLRHALPRKDRPLDHRKKLIITMDAAFGMEYLHSRNIVHFDLKCDNLLVNLRDSQRPVCKVGDFGLSRIKRNTLVSGGVRGTLPWMAPELLNGCSNKVSEKVDVFSFGIAMWEILTGEEPYANMHCGAIIGGILNDKLRPTIPENCNAEWKTLMEECWASDPASRPSFTQITDRLRAMSIAYQRKGQS